MNSKKAKKLRKLLDVTTNNLIKYILNGLTIEIDPNNARYAYKTAKKLTNNQERDYEQT